MREKRVGMTATDQEEEIRRIAGALADRGFYVFGFQPAMRRSERNPDQIGPGQSAVRSKTAEPGP